MEDHFPWLAVLEAVAKLAAAAALFAYLLHRGGVRPKAVAAVTLANLLALFCVLPGPAEFVFAATIALGTSSYAVLAVDRPWLRAGIVVACFVTIGTLLAQASGGMFLAALPPFAVWTGLMVTIRRWARAAVPTDDRMRGG
jgi:hypothetical protein